MAYDPKKDHMLMMRILGPIITFVNRPWKVSPVKWRKLFELTIKFYRCIPLGYYLDSVILQTTCLMSLPPEFKWMIISGFDTASSIALISVTALAKKGPNGTSISNSQIVIFPVF